MALVGKINRVRRRALLPVLMDGNTWQERCKNWNKLIPELAFISPEAMRKAYSYEKMSHRSEELERRILVDLVEARLFSKLKESLEDPQVNVLSAIFRNTSSLNLSDNIQIKTSGAAKHNTL